MYWGNCIKINIGDGCIVHNSVKCETDVTIGDKTSIKKNTVINNKVTIGSNCSIGANVNIGMNVIIGDNVFIDDGVQIDSFVTIGKSCKIDRDCKIGTGSVIGDVCIITDSIVHIKVLIGNNCLISSSSIGNNSKINMFSNIKNTIIGDRCLAVKGSVINSPVPFPDGSLLSVESVSGTISLYALKNKTKDVLDINKCELYHEGKVKTIKLLLDEDPTGINKKITPFVLLFKTLYECVS